MTAPTTTSPSDEELAAYDFSLPPGAIAQHPPPTRHAARMMTLDRRFGRRRIGRFPDLFEELGEGDCLVRNVARVEPCRLRGRREDTDGAVEALLLGPPDLATGRQRAMLRPARRMRPGVRIHLGEAGFTVAERHPDGDFWLEPDPGVDPAALPAAAGEVPLPPYIRADSQDPDRYQTTYARVPGSAAAPTAGFHFEPGDFEALARRGVEVVDVLLHVGAGTFTPVREQDIRRHRMHTERFEVTPEAAARLARARAEGRRIVAVGTTSVRVLESLPDFSGWEQGVSGETDLFLRPGHAFRMVDGLVTNFHLPRSSLLILVSAFAGRQAVLAAYAEARDRGFRFFSFGDVMWIR